VDTWCNTLSCPRLCLYLYLHTTTQYPVLPLPVSVPVSVPPHYNTSVLPLPTTTLYSDYNSGFGSLPASAYSQRHRDREEIKKITDVSTLSYSILSSCILLSSSIPSYPILYSTWFSSSIRILPPHPLTTLYHHSLSSVPTPLLAHTIPTYPTHCVCRTKPYCTVGPYVP
jgi:hypothetical protein